MKLFLAGMDSTPSIQVRYLAKQKNILTSFWAHKGSFPSGFKKWYDISRGAGTEWIMDSGLYTMMFGNESKRKNFTEKELIEYTYHYLDSIKKFGWKSYIVEMDVHKILGLESLKKFRKIFEENYPIEKTIFVWHIEEGKKGFDALCKKYPYIAISIPELRFALKPKSLKIAVKALIIRANKINPNIKIHLLGCTQKNLMEQSGYYSCDSTSWLSGAQWGTCGIWNIKTNTIFNPSIHSKIYKKYKQSKMNEWNEINLEIKLNDNMIEYWLASESYQKLNNYINKKYYK